MQTCIPSPFTFFFPTTAPQTIAGTTVPAAESRFGRTYTSPSLPCTVTMSAPYPAGYPAPHHNLPSNPHFQNDDKGSDNPD